MAGFATFKISFQVEVLPYSFEEQAAARSWHVPIFMEMCSQISEVFEDQDVIIC